RRSASGRGPPRSRPAPIIWGPAGRSPRRRIRGPPGARSSLKSPARRSHDREVEMAKGYWIPHIDVSDPEGYKAYMAATPPAHDKYRGRALVRGGAQEVVEGKSRPRNGLREFPDYATALACCRSGESERAKPLRLPHSVWDSVIIEGYDGVQPDRPAPHPAAAPRKGYWIAHVDVTEPEGYKAYMTADMA